MCIRDRIITLLETVDRINGNLPEAHHAEVELKSILKQIFGEDAKWPVSTLNGYFAGNDEENGQRLYHCTISFAAAGPHPPSREDLMQSINAKAKTFQLIERGPNERKISKNPENPIIMYLYGVAFH